MTIQKILIFVFVLVCSTVAGNTRAADKPVVYASNYPLYFFAQSIAGDAMEIRLPPTDGDPAYWVPDGEQLNLLQSADLVLLNGAGYESWLDFVSLREDRLADTTGALADRLLTMEEATVHQHGPEGAHSHAVTAFTTWLDPRLAALQASEVAKALSTLAPERTAGFTQRLELLEQQLHQLDQEMERTFEQLTGSPVIFSHPVYQYLQHRYGINGRSLHWEPGEMPGTRDWIDLQKLQSEHPAMIMIWEADPLEETVQRLAALGVYPVVFETAANRPDHRDYFQVMEDNHQQLLSVVQHQ